MDRLTFKYRRLLRAYRVLKADYAEQGESVATLREMVRTLRTELAGDDSSKEHDYGTIGLSCCDSVPCFFDAFEVGQIVEISIGPKAEAVA